MCAWSGETGVGPVHAPRAVSEEGPKWERIQVIATPKYLVLLVGVRSGMLRQRLRCFSSEDVPPARRAADRKV